MEIIDEIEQLFHISEEPSIERFEPRTSESSAQPVVWAIDNERLRNYLAPRDCPRVTFYAGSQTTIADVDRFLGTSSAVVAIESGWLECVRASKLYCYHMPPQTFSCIDECAGYYVSHVSVEPTKVEVIDPMAELVKRGVELRLLPELWTLRDHVVASTLQFSLIRMRNAVSRPGSMAEESSG